MMFSAMAVLGLLVGAVQGAFLQSVLPLAPVLATPTELLGNKTQDIELFGRTPLTVGVTLRVARCASPCAEPLCPVAGDGAASGSWAATHDAPPRAPAKRP